MGLLSSLSSAVAAQLSTMPQFAGVDVAVRHLYEIENAEMTLLHVSVCPRGAEISNISRNSWQYEARVGVFVAQHVDNNSSATALMTTTEAIIEKLQSSASASALTDVVGASASVMCMGISVDLATDDSMNERNLFRATLEATYKVVKNAAN